MEQIFLLFFLNTALFQWARIHHHLRLIRNRQSHTASPEFCLFLWFDSLRPISNLSVMLGRVFLGWTTTRLGLMCLTQWHNIVTLVRLKPAAPRSRVKHSTTEPLRFPIPLWFSDDYLKTLTKSQQPFLNYGENHLFWFVLLWFLYDWRRIVL